MRPSYMLASLHLFFDIFCQICNLFCNYIESHISLLGFLYQSILHQSAAQVGDNKYFVILDFEFEKSYTSLRACCKT